MIKIRTIPTDSVVFNTTKNFKERCLAKHSFSLPAVYLEYVVKNFDPNHIYSIIYHNNIDFAGSFSAVNYFIKFLYAVEDSISHELGLYYSVKVYQSLDYLDRWNFMEHKFTVDEYGDLRELNHID